MRRKPLGVELKTTVAQLGQHIVKVSLHEMRQQEAVVQLGAPTGGGCLVGLFPKTSDQGTQQELLHDAHTLVRWHFESAKFEQAQTSGG